MDSGNSKEQLESAMLYNPRKAFAEAVVTISGHNLPGIVLAVVAAAVAPDSFAVEG